MFYETELSNSRLEAHVVSGGAGLTIGDAEWQVMKGKLEYTSTV